MFYFVFFLRRGNFYQIYCVSCAAMLIKTDWRHHSPASINSQKQKTVWVSVFPKLMHSACMKPHGSSLWFWWDPLWSECVDACVCVDLWECVLRLPWILCVAAKDSICSSSAFSGSDAVCLRVFTHLFHLCAFACVSVCMWVSEEAS